MSTTATATVKFYSVTLMHPQHGMRKVESLAASLKEAESIIAKQWSATLWKVDHRG